jgi:hypothetical protein
VVTGMDYITKILNGEKVNAVKMRIYVECEGDNMFMEFISQAEIKTE